MPNRVVLGERMGQMGMWVSRPGFDVLSTGRENMLLAFDELYVQVIQNGRVYVAPSSSVDVPIPELGYFPFVLYSFDYIAVGTSNFVSLTYVGTTLIRFTIVGDIPQGTWVHYLLVSREVT